MKLTKVLILALMVDAAAVAVMQIARWTAGVWWLICLYWILLTAKNYVDWRRSNAKDED